MNLNDAIIPALQTLVTNGDIAELNFGGQLAALETDNTSTTPAVFVSPLREIAGETTTICDQRQTVEEQVQVIIVAKYEDFQDAREAIFTSLFGLNPYPPEVPAIELLSFVEGLQVDGTASFIYWRDIFSASRERRL